MPFPRSHPKDKDGHSKPGRVDSQFVFFLIWYYGIYCAVGE